MKPLRVIDLCCGAGLFSAGIQKAGHEIALGLDINQIPIRSFQDNFPNAVVWETDLLEVNSIPKCDIIIGGPPCQPFSKANRAPDHTNGMILVDKMLELVEASNPQFWIMEEVPPVIDYIVNKVPKSMILECSKFGSRNLRPRMFAGDYPDPIPLKPPCTDPAHTVMASDTTSSIELMRELQGVPSWMIFHGNDAQIREQIGNGVPIEMGEALGNGITFYLENRTVTDHQCWHTLTASYYRAQGGNRPYQSADSWKYCRECKTMIKMDDGIPRALNDGIPVAAGNGIPLPAAEGNPHPGSHGIPCPDKEGMPRSIDTGIPRSRSKGIPKHPGKGIPSLPFGIPSSRNDGINS